MIVKLHALGQSKTPKAKQSSTVYDTILYFVNQQIKEKLLVVNSVPPKQKNYGKKIELVNSDTL